MKESKIITDHIFPPIPIRDYDWSATRENYDDLTGYGKTKEEAIKNLEQLESDEYNVACEDCGRTDGIDGTDGRCMYCGATDQI
jgi:hypothetical protein